MPVTLKGRAATASSASDTGGRVATPDFSGSAAEVAGPALWASPAGVERAAPASPRTTRPADEPGKASSATVRRSRRWALFVGAALSVEAAWVHLWLVPQAFFDWWGFGAFFLGVGLAQAVLAAALLVRPTGLIVLGGIVGNLVVVTTYVLSRTTYMPAGPHAGSPETVGGPGHGHDRRGAGAARGSRQPAVGRHTPMDRQPPAPVRGGAVGPAGL